MKQTWRWFGQKNDAITTNDMLQAGVEGVVTALHHVPAGQVWTKEEIEIRIAEIAQTTSGEHSGLTWDVTESLPVSEEIKCQTGDFGQHLENYKQSLHNLAEAGVTVVCYNFMPVLDWTRTMLNWPLPSGATCMRFDIVDFAMFDLRVLRREGAITDYSGATIEAVAERFAGASECELRDLTNNILCGLPGATETYSIDDLRARLALYRSINADQLRANLIDFLSEVAPVAQEYGVRLCCHPDDPPFGLLGLPRIMSTEKDYARVMQAVDVPANGITLCSGSLGARPDNDLPGMMDRLGDRVHFLHLRNTRRDTVEKQGSFIESDHLDGDTDMVALVASVLRQESHRRSTGREDHNIPFRPDHGRQILDDLSRGGQPGYPLVGRLRGLAELRGVAAALAHEAERPAVKSMDVS